MQIKSKYLTSIICMLCVISICLSFIVVPAYADSNFDFVTDLLPAPTYTYRTGTVVGERDIPVTYFNNRTSASWSWAASTYNKTFRDYVFTVYSSTGVAPDRVTFKPYLEDVEHEAEFIGGSDTMFQYKVTHVTDISTITITGYFNNPYTGSFGIRDCVGILDTGVVCNPLAYKVTLFKDGRANVLSSNNTFNAPAVLVDNTVPYDTITFDTYIRNSRFELQYPSAIMLNVVSNMDDLEFGAYLAETSTVGYLSSADVVYTFSSDVVSSSSARFLKITEYATTELFSYTIIVDTENFDFGEYDFHISARSSTPGSNIYFEVVNCYMDIPVADIPWYQTFYQWLKDFFSTANQNIESYLEGINSSILNGTSTQQSQVQQDTNKLEGAGNELGQLTQDMELVKPPVEDFVVNSDAYVDPSATQMLIAPILELWNIPILVNVVLIVLTLMLISWVFFGKK